MLLRVLTFSMQVTDARATMAIYRLHRREWEKGQRLPLPSLEDPDRSGPSRTRKKRGRSDGERDNRSDDGKKGTSSGITRIVKRSDPARTKNTSPLASKKKTDWWSELGSSKGPRGIS